MPMISDTVGISSIHGGEDVKRFIQSIRARSIFSSIYRPWQIGMNRSRVISGYRSPRTNAALRGRSSGVAEHSLHMQGRAIDVRLGGFSTRRLHELARQMGRGGVGFYPQSDFVHLDSGAVRFW